MLVRPLCLEDGFWGVEPDQSPLFVILKSSRDCMGAVRNSPIYVADSLGWFLSKMALYLRYGYFFYSVIEIPEGRDLEKIDQKIVKTYEVSFCRVKRKRRREKGLSNAIYIRFDHIFILMATEGEHGYFGEIPFRDFRDEPLHFSGYSIGIKNGKPNVIISPKRFKAIRKQVSAIALHNETKLTSYFQRISPFKFAGISQQRWKLFREVNKRRKVAGLPQLEWEAAKGWRKKNVL